MTGNIKKIRDRQLAAPQVSDYMQELVLSELKEKKHTATEGMVWLIRYASLLPSPDSSSSLSHLASQSTPR